MVIAALVICSAWTGAARAAPSDGCDPPRLGAEVDQAAAGMSRRYELLQNELDLARQHLDDLRRRAAPLETQPTDVTAAVATYDAVERAMLQTSAALRQLEQDLSQLNGAYSEATPARDEIILREFDERLHVCEARTRAAQQSAPPSPPPPDERPQPPRYRRPGLGQVSP